MARDIIVSTNPRETRIALLEDGVVSELSSSGKRTGHRGQHLQGRVTRVLPGMQSAFVTSVWSATPPPRRDVFEELPRNLLTAEEVDSARSAPIEERLHEGEEVLVQVLKEPMGTKGADHLARLLPGRYVVLMPTVEHVGCRGRSPTRRSGAG